MTCCFFSCQFIDFKYSVVECLNLGKCLKYSPSSSDYIQFYQPQSTFCLQWYAVYMTIWWIEWHCSKICTFFTNSFGFSRWQARLSDKSFSKSRSLLSLILAIWLHLSVIWNCHSHSKLQHFTSSWRASSSDKRTTLLNQKSIRLTFFLYKLNSSGCFFPTRLGAMFTQPFRTKYICLKNHFYWFGNAISLGLYWSHPR